MDDSPPNLFNALFQFHPREGHTPKENFLSESFAHVLATSDAACDAWLSLAMGKPSHLAQSQVTTRATEHDEDSVAIYPDMRITGVLEDGEPFDLYSEHKWDSPSDAKQIRRYLKMLEQRKKRQFLAFICASYRQKREALNCHPLMRGKVFLWADIFQALERLPEKSGLLVQFLDFMKIHGLSPGKPIESVAMIAFIQSSGFLVALEHSANKLCDDYDWEFFPMRYREGGVRDVTNRWGRIAIEFATPAWKPTITVGFLVDEWDHGVTFVNRQKGIDLLLRIETAPRDQVNIEPALTELSRKKKKLANMAASVLLLREPKNDNTHTLLIARSCLAEIINEAATQQEQLDAIHETVRRWGEALFADGTLEKTFKQSGLDSGM